MPFPIVPNTFILTLSGVPEVLADFSSAKNIAKGVLSQEQGDVKLHLIAYDSRSLSIQEKKYGIQLVSIESTLIVNCTFQDSTSGAISSDTTGLIDTLIGAVMLYGSTGDVSITGCTFQNNIAGDCGDGYCGCGAVVLYGSTGDVSITGCTFQNNSAFYGGAVMLYGSTGNVSITDCTFQNSAGYDDGGGAVSLPSKKFLGKVVAKKSKILAGGQDLARRLRSCHILGKILARTWPAIILAPWARSWASLGQVGQDLGQVGQDLGQESCPRTFCWVGISKGNVVSQGAHFRATVLAMLVVL